MGSTAIATFIHTGGEAIGSSRARNREFARLGEIKESSKNPQKNKKIFPAIVKLSGERFLHLPMQDGNLDTRGTNRSLAVRKSRKLKSLQLFGHCLSLH
jgi:hypothetical protein